MKKVIFKTPSNRRLEVMLPDCMSDELPITEEAFEEAAKGKGIGHFSMGCTVVEIPVEEKFFKVCVIKESENDWPKIRNILAVFEYGDKIFYKVKDSNRLLRKSLCESCSCDNCYSNKNTLNCCDCVAEYLDWKPVPFFKAGDKVHLKEDRVLDGDIGNGNLSISKENIGEVISVASYTGKYNFYPIIVKFNFSGLVWVGDIPESALVLA